MKISILSPNLSSNCLGRAYVLAKLLQSHYEVEIVGPIFFDNIWKPVADDESIIYKAVKYSGQYGSWRLVMELTKKIEGDVLYASKPLFSSFGSGLIKKITSRKPLVLDIDDWDIGFWKYKLENLTFLDRIRYLKYSAFNFYNPESYWNNLLFEKMAFFSNKITVSNDFLKKKFGGEIIHHVRNTKDFDPDKFDKNLFRKKYGIGEDKKAIVFFGTTGPHKGIEDLIDAVTRIEDEKVFVMLVGVDASNDIVRYAIGKIGRKLKIFGLQPFDKIPEFLSMADIVVIPQRKSFATIGQTPAKVFDAMAMAKPIIATNVSDLPRILDGCGWIVEPDNSEKLAEAIKYVLKNPKEAHDMGLRARNQCIKEYSWEAAEKSLIKVFGGYEKKR